MVVGRPDSFGVSAVGKTANVRPSSRGFFEDAAGAIGKTFGGAASWLSNHANEIAGTVGNELNHFLPQSLQEIGKTVSDGVLNHRPAGDILHDATNNFVDNAGNIGQTIAGAPGKILGDAVHNIFGVGGAARPVIEAAGFGRPIAGAINQLSENLQKPTGRALQGLDNGFAKRQRI